MSLFTCFFLSLIARVHAAEQVMGEEVWVQLSKKVTQAQEQNKAFGAKEQIDPVQIDKAQRTRLVEQAFSKIEAESGVVFPEALKELHKRQEYLDTSFSFIILSPLGGILNNNGIMLGKRKGIDDPWVVFAHLTASEFFCINCNSGKVARFTVVPKVKQHDTYENLYEWLVKIVLKN